MDEPNPLDAPAAPKPDASLKDQFDYATKQFFFIADQRMKTFHFYVIVASAAVAATFHLTSEFDRVGYYSLFAAHVVIVAAFYVIERRNLCLLSNCKKSLIHLEEVSGWHEAMRMATRDDREMNGRWFTYRNAIKIAFAGQVVMAAMLLFYATGIIPIKNSEAKPQSNLKAVKNTTTARTIGRTSGGMESTDTPPTTPSQSVKRE